MKCNTCKKKIYCNYHEFPNGIYIVPKNKDDSVHQCEKLHIYARNFVHIDDINDFTDGEFYGFMSIFQYTSLYANDDSLKKDKNLANYILNSLFFINNHFCPDPYLIMGLVPMGEVSYDTASSLELLSLLSKIYELTGDLDSALKCEIIKNGIESEPNENLSRLYNLKEQTNSENKLDVQDNLLVENLRKKILIVEREIKSFLRKRLTPIKLKEIFPRSYDMAIKPANNQYGFFELENDDIFQYLTWGSLHFILSENNDTSRNENAQSPKELNFNISPKILQYIHINKKFRNDTDHYSDEVTIDEKMSENDKIILNANCNECIEYFQKRKQT